MIGLLRSRVDRWFLPRSAPSDTPELTQRNVHIVPTRAGWMLFVTLLVLLASSINYQLNLCYLMTFPLTSCIMVGLHVSHATLRGLALHLMPPEAQYAGSAAVFRIVLGSKTIDIAFKPERRGLHTVPPLKAETRFPLGTFRAWTVWRPASGLLV